MPKGEIEIHPFLAKGITKNAKKLILGSFPVYAITKPDNEKKREIRFVNSFVHFFYGSCYNHFWGLYRLYIDHNINLPVNINQIIKSLNDNKIAISDTIYSCERNNFSSLDKDLIKRVYNRDIIEKLIKKGVNKILCTSKGVLYDLEKQIISKKNKSFGLVDKKASFELQNKFIKSINGDVNQVSKPISIIFIIGGKKIEALAIPSPGSPQRKIKQFGFNGIDSEVFISNYFENAFNWLNTDN